MPMIEKEIDGKHRMVVKPDMADLYPDTIGMRSRRKSRDSKEAITRYKVLSERGNCALVQLEPETGEDLLIKTQYMFSKVKLIIQTAARLSVGHTDSKITNIRCSILK